MRTSAQIQSEAQQLATQLGMLRGEYLHREAQLTARLAALDTELADAAAAERANSPTVFAARLKVLEDQLARAQAVVPNEEK